MVDIPNVKPTEPKLESTETKPRAKKEIAVQKPKPIDVLISEFSTSKEKQVAFLEVLSAQPPRQWLRNTDQNNPDNPFMKDRNGTLIPYLDVQRQWYVLDMLLMQPRLEILKYDVQQLVNDKGMYVSYAVCTVRLHYIHHGLGQDTYIDGVAAEEIGKGNQKLSLVFPKLKTEAFKNAVKSIGNIFGRSLDTGDEFVITTEKSPFTREVAKNKLIEGIE